MDLVTRLPAEFDLQPDPRILPMLGEINLPQWRCVAELIDNAADSFISAKERGAGVAGAEIHVHVPTSDSRNARVIVRDNGPGMDAGTLERAVRAGWSGNDPVGRLGMFGMGFNIATARLGTVTTVWTTREEDSEWCGLVIDFGRLMAQRSFRTPRLSRPKTDPHEHGTEVSIEQLKPEQRAWFARTANRSRLEKELGRAYSSMLRPNGIPVSFRLFVNNVVVRGRDHCIWGGEDNPERVVQTSRYGQVSSYQVVNRRLADRAFCTKCWQWLAADETTCPACGNGEDIVLRQRRIHGWLGIQRYLSSTDYGIDFIRHGRKIEIASRELFSWAFDNGEEVEYPRDDQQRRGRIVGEIHLDHCRVTYMKDRFDRSDPAWEEMYQLVHGAGPLQPDKAEQAGFGPNSAPLYLLFQAFRRSSPKPKVAGCWAKLLLVPDNDLAEQMARRFHDGESQYQTDAKWWELVEEADRALLVQPTGAGQTTRGDLEDFGTKSETYRDGVAPDQSSGQPSPGGQEIPERPPIETQTPPPKQTPILSLSHEYRDDATQIRWDIRAFAVETGDQRLPDGAPWRLTAMPTGVHEFLVNPAHSVFRSATMTPLDALLAQLAWSAVDFLRGGIGTAPSFPVVLASLRDKYGGTTKLDPAALSNDASQVLVAIARSLPANVSADDSLELYGQLGPDEQNAILRRMASRPIRNPQEAIAQGRFLEFAPRKTLLRFFERHPELFLDGRYWDSAYASLDYLNTVATEEARAEVVSYYSGLMSDAIWLAEQDASDLAEASRERLLRASLSLELLSSNIRVEGAA